jgi:hypothetical protein
MVWYHGRRLLLTWVSMSEPASPVGTAISTTPSPIHRLFLRPCISFSSFTSTRNHSTEKHSKGETRGNSELLKAVTLMIRSGPNR